MNLHDTPSQMTIILFIECIVGKFIACMGKEGDGTPFIEVTVIIIFVYFFATYFDL